MDLFEKLDQTLERVSPHTYDIQTFGNALEKNPRCLNTS